MSLMQLLLTVNKNRQYLHVHARIAEIDNKNGSHGLLLLLYDLPEFQ